MLLKAHLGGCQNCGPFLDPYYNTTPNIYGTPKGTIILTTTHMLFLVFCFLRFTNRAALEARVGALTASKFPC